MRNIYVLVAQAAMRLRCKLQVIKSASVATFSALYVQSLWQYGATPFVTQQPINHQTNTLSLIDCQIQTVKTTKIISYKLFSLCTSLPVILNIWCATQTSTVKLLLVESE